MAAPAMPNITGGAATSSAKNGDFLGGSGSVMSSGAWTVVTGGGDNGLTSNAMLWAVVGAGALWFLMRKKKAA